MRSIDADALKEKLLKIRDDIINKNDAWKAAYLLILDEYIKMIDEMPRVTPGCDADAILDAYGKGYSKGREDVLNEEKLMEDYCKNDCYTLREVYNKAYSKGDKND